MVIREQLKFFPGKISLCPEKTGRNILNQSSLSKGETQIRGANKIKLCGRAMQTKTSHKCMHLKDKGCGEKEATF